MKEWTTKKSVLNLPSGWIYEEQVALWYLLNRKLLLLEPVPADLFYFWWLVISNFCQYASFASHSISKELNTQDDKPVANLNKKIS